MQGAVRNGAFGLQRNVGIIFDSIGKIFTKVKKTAQIRYPLLAVLVIIFFNVGVVPLSGQEKAVSADEVQKDYEVENYRGKPVVFEDGEPTSPYCYNLCYDLDAPGSKKILRKFAKNNCKVFMLPVRGGVDGEWGKTAFWTDDGAFPKVPPEEAEDVSPSDMDNFVLDLVPDARLWVRFSTRPPSDFRRNNPDHMLLNSYGKRYREASLASELCKEQMKKFVRNVVAFCESRPWADRVIGYLNYPMGEGTTHLTCEGYLFDQSPVMQEAFRRFLKEKYGSDEKLQAAWASEDVTLESVEVPSDQEWHEAGETVASEIGRLGGRHESAPHRLHWPEPEEMVAVKDYCECMRQLTEHNFRTVLKAIKAEAPNKLAGLDAFKQTMLGWPLMARSSGTHVYCEKDALIFADSTSLTVHSVCPGDLTIKLPGKRQVWDLREGKELGKSLQKLHLKIDPPQTELFRLGRAR
ncbi:MAG: hypothetical protein ACLFWL_05270 [Candidatus Brocadiia bacterium]